MALTSINGRFSKDLGAISTNDRGFLFGESVYEVIPLYHKKTFGLDIHLDRLETGFQYFSKVPLPMDKIRHWIHQYIQKLPYKPCDNIYIQITTGPMKIRDHLCKVINPTVIIQQTYMEPVTLERYLQGFKATCIPDHRSSFSSIKTNHLAHNTLGLRDALDQGFDTGIFIKNNCIREGVSSNFFGVMDNRLITPPAQGILPGITRQTILDIAKKHDIPYEITAIPLTLLPHLDEAFLTSSTKLLQPLIQIDNHFQKDAPGPLWRYLFDLYQEAIHEACQPDLQDHG